MPRKYHRDCDHCGITYSGNGKRFCSYPCSVAALGDLESRWNAAVPDRPEDGCWEWKGAINGEGYGSIRSEGQQLKAHRVSYVMFVGPIPLGKLVRHKCDNPPCVNPGHLELGDQAANNWDTRSRGRFKASAGERNGSAKITDKQAEEIRRRYAAGGVLQRELASEYGLTQQGVSIVIARSLVSG